VYVLSTPKSVKYCVTARVKSSPSNVGDPTPVSVEKIRSDAPSPNRFRFENTGLPVKFTANGAVVPITPTFATPADDGLNTPPEKLNCACPGVRVAGGYPRRTISTRNVPPVRFNTPVAVAVDAPKLSAVNCTSAVPEIFRNPF
jgi:hypothetical protein